MKEKLKNISKKTWIIIGSVCAITLIAIISILLLNKNNEEGTNEYKLVEATPIVTTLEDGTIYIFASPVDQFFEVKPNDNFSYEVLDEDNKRVDVPKEEKDDIIIIKSPENGYEEGKSYTLKITNGEFVNEEYKKSKTITFSIVRSSKQSANLKEDIKYLNNRDNKVEEQNNKITLQSKETLKENDIIIIGEGMEQSTYKVGKKDGENYILSIPSIDEVFEELDYYGSAYLDLSEFVSNPELDEYLIAYAENNLIDKIIPKVSAAPKITIKKDYDKKNKELKATFHIETNPEDKVFDKSFLKYHRLSFDFETKIKFKVNYDLHNKIDVNLTVEFVNTPSVKLEHASESLDKIKDGLSAYTQNANVAKTLKSDYNKIETDKKKLEQSIGTITVPTPVAGLNVEVDLGLIMDFDVKANLGATLTNTNTAVFGYSNKKGLYGDFKYDNKIDANLFGSASMRLGSNVDAGINFMGLVRLDASVSGGIYGKAEVDIETKIGKKEISTKLNAKSSAGLFTTTKVKASALGLNAEKVLFDGEVELYKYELPLESTNKVQEETPNEQPVTKPTDTPVSKPEEQPESTQKTYTVTVYDFVQCSEAEVIKIATLKVPEGMTIKDYLIQSNMKDSWGGLQTYGLLYEDEDTGAWISSTYVHTYNSGVKDKVNNYNTLKKQYDECMDACNYDTDQDCWKSCVEPNSLYDYIGSLPKYSVSTPINKNISIIGKNLIYGCGASSDEVD